MVAYEVTLKVLRQAKACKAGYNKIVCSLQGQPFTDKHRDMKSYIRFSYKEPISLSFILENNGLYDALWVLRCIKDAARDIRLFSVWCARQVQHLMRDSRSTNALDVAERFANGKATKEELEAASLDARDARDAASVAREVADVASVNAWDASAENAENAANVANVANVASVNTWAASAAWAASAVSAAWAASAENAARAARDAALAVSATSVESAAWDAAFAAQTEMFKLMCDGKAPWQVSGLD